MTHAELNPAAALKAGLFRFVPLAILAAGAALFFALGPGRHISLDALRANRETAGHRFRPLVLLPLRG
jgi:hypothetical protein